MCSSKNETDCYALSVISDPSFLHLPLSNFSNNTLNCCKSCLRDYKRREHIVEHTNKPLNQQTEKKIKQDA